MSSIPTPDVIGRDATWMVQALDAGADKARIVRMTADSYRAASFLDDRMFQQPQDSHIVEWGLLAAAVDETLRRDARWIFHIGHVGSTLIARLLGEIEGVLSVREPRALRDLTTLSGDRRQPYTVALQRLLSRSFAPSQTALVKATSFVSEIAPDLVPPGERALFVYAGPRAYIESILAGENSRKEMAMLADIRLQRMAPRTGQFDGAGTSEAHLAAVAWACEMTALESAADAMPDRQIEWADFDRMLGGMEAALTRVAGFFGFAAPPVTVREIANGQLMRRYSKALEYEYSPNLRRELLAEAGRDHKRDIDSALAMLSEAAENAPLLARALDRAHRND